MTSASAPDNDAIPTAATDLAAVVLAAGRGSRMSPLTDVVPKPLLTINNRTLLALALDRMSALTTSVAVNAHHLAEQIAVAATNLLPEVFVSFERDKLLGTAGALHHLRDWIDGRPVVINNSDVWLSEPIDYVIAGWDGRRPRLLVEDLGHPSDFGNYRYLGVSTLPAQMAAALQAEPSGLYSAVWQNAYRTGDLEFVELQGQAFDCGTAAEFITANRHAAGTDSVVSPDARVLGDIDRCVILAGARVEPGEQLVAAVRDRFGNTITADPAQLG